MITSNSTGKTASLGTLATFESEVGQTEIQRENLQRDVAVTGRFDGVSLGKGMEMVQQAVTGSATASGDSRGLWRYVRRAAEIVQGSSRRARTGGGAGVYRPAGRISDLCRAHGDSGVGAALDVGRVFRAPGHGDDVQHLLVHGLIMVIGIVAKNGILLLDADERYRAEGYSAHDAMIEAGARRLRPILMTALATIAGMIPLSLALGSGSQMLQPLAIAVIGGIVASMCCR